MPQLPHVTVVEVAPDEIRIDGIPQLGQVKNFGRVFLTVLITRRFLLPK